MDKFIVSARKYRPQSFDTVVGQSHITTTLKNAIRNRQLAHAFLFCGPRGVGKTTCARILAKTINCEQLQPDGEACNTCPSCVAFNEGISLNIHELDAASNNSVDDIRSLVDQVRFAPQAGDYKVYIIDEVHMLSAAAFNAFLKTLEEPPSYAIFILATTEKHKILPTILSRCQIFDFKRINASDTVDHLLQIAAKEQITTEKAALHVIAQKSEGCMRDALSILDKIVSFTNGDVSYRQTLEHLNILDEDYYFKLMDCMLQQDLAGALLLFDEINRRGFDEELVLNGFSEFVRNLLVSTDERVAALLEVVEDFKVKYAALAKKTTAGYLVSALNLLNETELNYKAARNKRLHVELALIRLVYLGQALELTTDGGEVVKKKPVENARPIAFRNIPAMQPARSPMQEGPKLTIRKSPGEKTPATPREAATDPKANTAKSPLAEHSAGPEVATGPTQDKQQNPAKKAAGEPVSDSALTANAANQGAAGQTASSLPAIADPTPLPGIKTSKLENIRKQFADKTNAGKAQPAIPLEPEKLKKHWDAYTDILKENKNPAVPSFQLATLHILSDNHFEVITNNNLEQKFIEGEKRLLSEQLQKAFHNRALHFSITVTDDPAGQTLLEKTLTKKDQFVLMVQQYPIIKELKDKLKLELDY